MSKDLKNYNVFIDKAIITFLAGRPDGVAFNIAFLELTRPVDSWEGSPEEDSENPPMNRAERLDGSEGHLQESEIRKSQKNLRKFTASEVFQSEKMVLPAIQLYCWSEGLDQDG